MKIALYPGTFDPITRGHLDIIVRASRLVDHLIIAVATNAGKGPIFTLQERLEMAEHEIQHLNLSSNQAILEVKPFHNLLVDFARAERASMIVRGLRAVSDFDYEFQMAGLNKVMNSQIETIFLVASESSQFISSTYIKEIAFLKGNIEPFVSPYVASQLDIKINHKIIID